MNWTFEQRAQLFHLAEAGVLAQEQLERAGGHGALHPGPRDWRWMLDRLLAFGGALLLGAGVVFFFAYNWDALHRFAKFGLAAAALLGCGLAALWAPPRGVLFRAALFGACIATGALLALIGQSYQTGADVWELFAAWAALMLPFVLLSRSSANWALWLAVANMALLRALSQSALWWYFDALFHLYSLLLVAGLNLAVLLAFELLGRCLLCDARRWMARLAAIGVVVPLCVAAVAGWFEPGFRQGLTAFALAATAGGLVYGLWRRDVAMLALLSYAAIAVLTAGLARLLDAHDFLALNGLGLFVILASSAAGWWLTRLHRAGGGGSGS
ncbi:DUF2157 domain-containing protein [Thauera linaloolentis]|uniref:DUF2157 domain-containing protein n=1 Tax=Thauera linaloolentis (strain DSM 12138 / JCM 21573 / CCUG 41526 / CIP 105981 / IAM 15112 / NBRC 102519 / 47Lol) TaxID=1123367 RepID=N6Z3M1_THAL4|nr:DUF2157 domain-containing protein [Thauera linaloolentis]ENO86744.1 hypothetical protein C666_12455 [Thauera linaloolentis 47Lol = DSM 12138]MCM8567063.1 DUF2157 domain-containing protein [Thauera linaloolentis]